MAISAGVTAAEVVAQAVKVANSLVHLARVKAKERPRRKVKAKGPVTRILHGSSNA